MASRSSAIYVFFFFLVLEKNDYVAGANTSCPDNGNNLGRQGFPGVVGPQGLPGLRGLRGDRGAPGAFGPPGRQGLPGVVGPQGLPGLRGLKGDRGEKGQADKVGPKGYKGEPGYTGLRGYRGYKGEPGLSGLRGEKGESGSIASRPAAHLYGTDTGAQRSIGYVFLWSTSASGSFLDNGMTYSNGYITVPKTGLYYVYAQVVCNPIIGGWCGHRIRANGIPIADQHYQQHNTGQDVLDSQTSELGLFRKLNRGDRLSVVARTTAFYYYANSLAFFGAVCFT